MSASPSRPEPERPFTERALAALCAAFAFLTVIPVGRFTREIQDGDVKASRFAYPIVGLVLGLLFAGLSVLLQRWGIAAPVAAFLLVAGLAAFTGGLHLDGLGDTADGIFLWGDPARRLEVMRDPRIGSYGLIAIVLGLLGKFAALSSLTGRSRALALFGAIAVSRTLLLVSAGRAPYARPDGTGRLIIEATTPQESLAAAAVALLTASLASQRPGLAAGLLALATTLALTHIAKHRLGGISGDILGASVELSETAYLLALSSLLGT